MSRPTLEYIQFKLKDSVDKDEFLKAANNIEPWLNKTCGFIKRKLSKSHDGQWVDIHHWNSLSQAIDAAERMMKIPEGRDFDDKIDETTIVLRHMQHSN